MRKLNYLCIACSKVIHSCHPALKPKYDIPLKCPTCTEKETKKIIEIMDKTWAIKDVSEIGKRRRAQLKNIKQDG